MKVCLVSSYFPPYVGGIETYVSSLAQGLAQMGHRVTVYCSSRRSVPGSSFSGMVRVVRFRTPLILYGAPLGIFPRDFIAQDYDVIHANSPNPYFAAVSAWAGLLKNTPSVLTWHNDLPAVTPAASILVNAHRYLATSYLDAYDTIIATTSTYAAASMTLRTYSGKVKVVMNGVDTDRFRPGLDGDEVRSRFGLHGCCVVLFVGALTRWHVYKGLNVLIEAFAKAVRTSPSMRLLVIGSGGMSGEYRAMAKGLGVGDKVIFAGHVPDSDLPEFYAAGDVTVLPSTNSSEGFGLVLLEAMACGRPVIGSSVGGIPDLIRNGQNGLLVEPGDRDALATALVTVSENSQGRESMGMSGRKFAELHDWRTVASQVESIYRDLQ